METTRIQNGNTERIVAVAINDSGYFVTGLTDVLLKIRRDSDNKYLDFSDNTFKASGWVSLTQQMAELDAANYPGRYSYDFDTTGFTDDTYRLIATSVSAEKFEDGELKVGGYVDNLDVAVSGINVIVTDIQNIVKNKLTIDTANSKLQLWDAAGTTVLYEWPLTDKDGAAIQLQAGPPANRWVPV